MDKLIFYLEALSLQIPLTLYVFLGGLIEEIIAPIPSPLVMTSAGSIALEQGRPFASLILLGAIAAVGKTIGSVLIYVVADKAEDILVTKFGKFIGVTHKEVEAFGSYFNNTAKDDLILILLRAIPLFPGAPVAAVCGLVKLNMKTYIRSTFIGTWIRSVFFAVIGYYGLSQLKEGANIAEDIGKLLFVVIAIVAAGIFLYAKRNGAGEKLMQRVNKRRKI